MVLEPALSVGEPAVHTEGASEWEGKSASELAAAWGAPEVLLFHRVGSTNDVARALAADGAPHGTTVLADEQLAGRGRVGRAWSSPPGLGIWLSVVVRPVELPDPGALPLLVGLAAAESLDPFDASRSVGLKWPNDLVAGPRKLGGILCEAVWDPSGPAFVVVGIGLNVLHVPEDFPEELRGTATSLRIVSGRAAGRLEVAGALARAVSRACSGAPVLTQERLAMLERRDVLRGRDIVVTDPHSGEELTQGTALGVSPDGALLLRTRSGVLRTLHSGTVRLAG